MELDTQVKAVLAKSLMLDVASLNDDMRLVEDLGISSMDRFEIVMDLEATFGVELTPEDQEGINTIGDAVRVIRERAAKPCEDSQGKSP